MRYVFSVKELQLRFRMESSSLHMDLRASTKEIQWLSRVGRSCTDQLKIHAAAKASGHRNGASTFYQYGGGGGVGVRMLAFVNPQYFSGRENNFQHS